MKKLLIILAAGICSWHTMHGAASSEEAAGVTPQELTVAHFLHRAHLDPNRLEISSSAYYGEHDHGSQRTCQRLRHIRQQATPLIRLLFTSVPQDEPGKESLFHAFLAGRIALKKLFSSGYSKMSSLSSASSADQTLAEILATMTNDDIRRAYWTIADEQPDHNESKFSTAAVAGTQRETISEIRAWFTAFKEAQHDASTPSDEATLENALEDVFEGRCTYILAQRASMQEHITPGLTALARLQQVGNDNNENETHLISGSKPCLIQ